MHHCRHITCAPLSVTTPAARVLRGSGGVTHHAAADTHHPYLLAASDAHGQVGQPLLAGPDPDAATVDAAKVTHQLAQCHPSCSCSSY